MNFQLKNIAAVLAATTLFVSCSNDDDNGSKVVEGAVGEAELFFDNGVAGDALDLGNSYTNSNGETFTVKKLNYIVSNVILIKEDGSQFVYPKGESYFIISEEKGQFTVHLENVPAGDYKKVKFGIGVDQQRYLEGESAQKSFWDLAFANDMTWTWSIGYRFINFEGTFPGVNGEGVNEDLVFQVHQGSNSSTDNYREVILDLPTTARVREKELSSIHIMSDVNVLLDGDNKILLRNNLNAGGTAVSIMGGENLIKIAQNSLKMFKVDHVHNGPGSHHE